MSESFNFVIMQLIREHATDKLNRRVVIQAKAPTLVFQYQLSSEIESERDRLRLAIAELKIKLIQEISQAEFTFEEVP